MSLKCGFSSLSLGASVDQQTGSLSVFDVVDEIRTPQVPINIQSFVLTMVWENTKPTDYDGKVFIHILTPDGKQAMVGNGELKVPGDQKRLKAVFRFGGFPVLAFGEHRFVLSWVNAQGTKEGEEILDFDVIQVTQVAQGASPAQKPGMQH